MNRESCFFKRMTEQTLLQLLEIYRVSWVLCAVFCQHGTFYRSLLPQNVLPHAEASPQNPLVCTFSGKLGFAEKGRMLKEYINSYGRKRDAAQGGIPVAFGRKKRYTICKDI